MAAARQIAQAVEALALESGAPALDAADRNAQARRDRTSTAAFGARQNDPRTRGVPSRCVLVGARTRAESSDTSSGVSSSVSGGRPRLAEVCTSASYRTGIDPKCTALFPPS
jgi:hypothetical protein